MSSVQKQKRSELSNKISSIAKQRNLPLSEIVRNALQFYIEKIENELEAGYKANYNYYLKTQEDWKFADKE